MAESVKQNEIVDNTANVNPIEEYIYTYYSDRKQSQDIMWETYYKTILTAQKVTDIENKVVNFVIDVKSGKDIEDVVKDVPDEQKQAFIKLIKIALRIDWAKICIDEGLSAIRENREPNFPEFPKI